MKHCNSCGEDKELSEFYKRKDKWQHKCKSCEKAYKEKNEGRQKELKRNYYLKNVDKVKQRSKKYKKTDGKRMRIKLFTDRPIQKLIHNQRCRISSAITKERKFNRTLDLIGCTPDFLKKHIELKFKKGMTWGNYGDWHVDHKIPCALFDLTKQEQQAQCFHYTNLQPLWAKENLIKGDRILVATQTHLPL